ncbi:MAG: HEAT repeat domain-containing protein [Chloroflexi bacterium]|nr:HEAT repeat domain-containing protein [Chloroflexota bacterium]
MKLEVLLGGLNNAEPAVRLDVVRVLGMLDETRALEALRERYQKETDPNVRNAIAWAGKRLFEARQAGYSTIDEIFRHFNVDKEIEHVPNPDEIELMRKMQDSLDADLLRMKSRATKRQAGLAVAAGMAGGMIGGSTMALSAMSGALAAGADVASSAVGAHRPQIGTTRAPATIPSNSDISIWLKRLRTGKTAQQREQAAIELGQLNNPAALPHLAAVFVGDSSPQVRQVAQRFGKQLYWGAIYWDMEQSGELQKEMERRAAALGKQLSSQPQAGPAAGAAPTAQPGSAGADASAGTSDQAESGPSDVSDILRKAEAARKRRKRGSR